MREDITAVFNNDSTIGTGMSSELKAPTYAEHNLVLSAELGLELEHTAGIGTAAQMENVSIKTESFECITVTAIVTGGVEVNDGRVGELIGVTVKAAVKEALSLQSNMNPKRQHDALRLMSRFGITAQSIWKIGNLSDEKSKYWLAIEDILKRDDIVTATALYVHLIDQLDWGLASYSETYEYANLLLQRMVGETLTASRQQTR